jgi:putative DNA primase/helicase
MLERAMHTPRFIMKGDSNRVFILQSKSDLEYFRSFTKDQNDYSSEFINSTNPERLRGKDLIIIQIKNEAGRNDTEKFLRKIGNVIESFKVLEVPGEENESFEDWVCSQPENSSIDILIKRLNDLIQDPPELKYPSLRTSADYLITSFETFNRSDMPERKIIMSPWLEEGSLILLSAPPGVGKSLFAMEIASSCSEGRDAMNGLWSVKNPISVLYVDGEMHWVDLKMRSELLGLGKCLVLSKVFYEHKNGYPPINIADKEDIRDPLTAYILERGIKLLILDNIYSLVVGLDHNFEREWSPINQWLISLRNKGIAVIIVHHTGKKGDQLGTSSRKFNIDYSFMLEKKHHPEGVSGNCAFSVIVDKERRPVSDVRKKIFALHQEGWTVHDVSDIKTNHADKKRRKLVEMLIKGMRNKDIAEYFKCTPANISQLTRKLHDQGIIRRVQTSTGWIYEHTERGQKWYDQSVS